MSDVETAQRGPMTENIMRLVREYGAEDAGLFWHCEKCTNRFPVSNEYNDVSQFCHGWMKQVLESGHIAAALARAEQRATALAALISEWAYARDYAHGKAFKVGDEPLQRVYKAEDALRAAIQHDGKGAA